MSANPPPDLVRHFEQGARELQLGQPAQALRHFDAALAIDATSAPTLYNRGLALHQLGRLEEAYASFERAARAQPTFTDALDNAHALLVMLGRYAEAVVAIRERLARHPPHASVLTNLSLALQHLGHLDEGRALLEEAVKLEPDYRIGSWNLALSELRDGDLARGFERYRRAWPGDSTRHRPRRFAIPELASLDAARGRKVLVHADEGLGDSILYARFLPALAKAAGAVIVEAQPEMEGLLRGSFPGLEIAARGEVTTFCDLHCPMHALPALFEVTAASLDGEPYLVADAAARERWRGEVDGAFRVGLAWSGDPRHPDDRRRSLSAAQLEPLLDLPSCTFVSLQKEMRPADAQALQRHPQVRQLGPRLADLSQTAALAASLDLVITIDTMVAHLAGALGVETWVLLAEPAEWRWMRNRTDSPWYRSMRLYRQRAPGDWSSVIADVATELAARRVN